MTEYELYVTDRFYGAVGEIVGNKLQRATNIKAKRQATKVAALSGDTVAVEALAKCTIQARVRQARKKVNDKKNVTTDMVVVV